MQNEKKQNEVCPFCGNDRFLWVRKAQQTVLIDGSFEAISVYDTTVLDYYDDEPMPRPICNNCQNAVPGFVTEEFFHLTICDDAYEDTIPFFVKGNLLREYIRFIYQPFDVSNFPPEPIYVSTSTHPFLLKICLRQDEQGILRQHAVLLTHEQATSEHVKTVEVETEIKLPPAVAGRYVFDFKGKTYSVYILEEQFAADEDAEEIDIKSISFVAIGNTEGNEYDNENFTILYTGQDGKPYWGRTPDDRIARDFIKNLIANGVIKEDIRLIPPCSDVDIDDFIQEG